MSKPRVPYDQDDDRLLMKYIATYNPENKNRMGNVLYQQLVDDAEGKWPWSKRHSWQSWRERYKDNRARFDAEIKKYQKKKGIRRDAQPHWVSSLTQGQSVRNETSEGQAQGSAQLVGNKERSALSFVQSSSNGKRSAPRQPSDENLAETGNLEAKDSGKTSIDPRRSPGSTIPKSFAQRPARKTAIAPEPHDEGDGENNEEEIPESAITVSEEEESTADGKRKADGPGIAAQAKRRRVENGTDEANEIGPSGSTSGNVDTSHATVAPSHQVHSSEGSTSATRVLEILSSFETDDNGLDKNKVLDLLLQVLQPKPEEKHQIIELAKPFLSVAPPTQNEDDTQRIYPRLEDDDYHPGAVATVGNVIPGAWDAAREPVGFPSKQVNVTGNGMVAVEQSVIGSGGMQVGDRREIYTSSNDSPAHLQQQPSSKIVEDDFFKTPSPSPAKVEIIQRASGGSRPQALQEGAISRTTSHDISRTQLPRRDPPRFASGTFRNALTPSRKHALSRTQAPDVDTGSDTSDTEIIPNENAAPLKTMNETQVPTESWPPPRSKKVVGNEAQPARISGSVRQSAGPVAQEPPRITSTMKTATVPSRVASQRPEDKPQTLSPTLVHSYTPRTSGPRASHAELPAHVSSSAKASILKPNKERKEAEKNSAFGTVAVSSPFRVNRVEKTQITHPKSQIAVEAGPSKIRNRVPLSLPVDKANKTENIHAWRSETRLSGDQEEEVSPSSVSDPFLTSEHAKSLRQKEKDREKEQRAANEDRSRVESEAKAARRRTFGGLSTSRPPEIDLRRRALRSSVADNLPSHHRVMSPSPPNTQAADEEDKEDDEEGLKSIRRASVAATVDLSREFPSPEMDILSRDATAMLRTGGQVLIQAIAQNYSVSEELVQGIYEELLDLRATDRVVAKMRRVTDQTGEGGREQKEGRKERSTSTATPVSQGSSSPKDQLVTYDRVHSEPQGKAISVNFVSGLRAHSRLGRRYSDLVTRPVQSSPVSRLATSNLRRVASTSALSSPERRGPDISIVPASRVHTLSESRRRHSELFITPADEDPTYVRLRSQYVPPSASRAARLIRHRARRSSGLASRPLNGLDASMQVDGNYDENEKEEEEVTLALTPARLFDEEEDHSEDDQQVVEPSPLRPASATTVPQKTPRRSITRAQRSNHLDVKLWTPEEDDILLGENEKAIEAIIQKRGKFAVRTRMAELAQ